MTARIQRRWSRVTHALTPFLCAGMLLLQVLPALALPQGGNVTHGQATIRQFGDRMVVIQRTPNAVINYNSFNIGGHETVRFIQPGPNAAVLNRVTGGGRSTIAGSLLANGHVYLINPNGILFSSSARVNVGGLVASGLGMSDRDFLSRNMRFSGGGGEVINHGSINAGGMAYLVGRNVENHGSIRARDVVLAAGAESVVIDRAFDGKIRITVDGVEQPEDGNFNFDVEWKEGAPISSIENRLHPEWNLVDDEDEEFNAGEELVLVPIFTNGLVFNFGHITVPGDDKGQINLRGVRVAQLGTVQADGEFFGGGDVGVFGNELVIIGRGSHTSANAGLNGDGGEMLLIARGFLGIEEEAYMGVRGGSLSGNGGFVETSGHEGILLLSNPDAHAPHGVNGHWLIDPPNFVIDNKGDRRKCNFLGFNCKLPIKWDEDLMAVVPTQSTGYMDVSDLRKYLGEYGAMSIRTSGLSGSNRGDISLRNNLNYNSLGNSHGLLVFNAGGVIFLNGSITSSDANSSLSVIMLAGMQIQVNSTLNTQGGDVLFVSGTNSSSGTIFVDAPISTGGGHVTMLSQSASILINSSLNAGNGQVFLSAPGTVRIGSTFNAGRLSAIGSNVEITGTGNATINNDAMLIAQAGQFRVNSGGRLTSTGGDILISASGDANITGISAPVGNVIIAARNIRDSGDVHTDLRATYAMLIATNGIIGGSNPLETDIAFLSGYAGGGQFSVRQVASTQLQVQRATTTFINPAGSIDGFDSNYRATLSPISTNIPGVITGVLAAGTGYIDLNNTIGGINVSDPVIHTGNGAVLLTALNAGANIAIADTVASQNSYVSIRAGGNVSQSSAIAALNSYVNVDAGGNIIMANITNALTASGFGNIRYRAGNNATLQTLITSNGSIYVNSGNNVIQNGILYTMAGGSVFVESGGSITMDAEALAIVGANRNIRYDAGGNVTIGSLIATQGIVEVFSGSGSILSGGTNYPEVIAQQAKFVAPGGGVGTLGPGATPLIVSATNVAALGGSGGINLIVGGPVSIGSVGPANVNRVNASGSALVTSWGTLAGYTTINNGSIVHIGDGTTRVREQVVAVGTGNIAILGAPTNNNDLIIMNRINSDLGSTALIAGRNLTQIAGTLVESTGGHITMGAPNGILVQANTARTISRGGDIVMFAQTNIFLSSASSGTGTITMLSLTGSIFDFGDAHLDAQGAAIQFLAPNGTAGTSINPFETGVDRVAAFTGDGGLYLQNNGNLAVGPVGPVPLRIVDGEGALVVATNIAQVPGVIVSNGAVNVSTINGRINVDGPIYNLEQGNITLTAGGFLGDINVSNNILAVDGNVRLTALYNITQVSNIFAAGDGYIVVDALNGSITMSPATTALTFTANGNILYKADQNASIANLISSNGNITVQARQQITLHSNIFNLVEGTIDILSTLGSVSMADGALAFANDGNIRVQARNNVTVGSLISTQGNVAVIAQFGSILDGGESLPDIIAQQALLSAVQGGIGTLGPGANALEISVTNLAAVAGGGGMHIVNVGHVVITDVGPVPVERVATTGLSSPVGGSPSLSGLTTSSDGTISLTSLGSITVDRPVDADGTGGIFLATVTGEVSGVTYDIVPILINTNVQSGSGDISIVSGGDIEQRRHGNVLTGGGDIAAVALQGAILQTDGVRTETTGGTIANVARDNVVLSSLHAHSGDVVAISLEADLIDGGDLLTDIIGSQLFVATLDGRVGSATNRIETDIDALAGYAANGGIFILEDDDLVIGMANPLDIDIILNDAGVLATNIPIVDGLFSTNGSILVDTIVGSIDVQGTVGVLTEESLRLSANGGGSDLSINGIVYAAGGPVSLLGANHVLINTVVVSEVNGTIDVEAFAGSILMSDDAIVISGERDVRMTALGDVVLGSVIATQGAVRIEATLGSILDGGDTYPEILAAEAQLVATNAGIGVLGAGVADGLETGIGRLAALAGAGGINLANGGNLEIGTVNQVAVDRVDYDAGTTPIVSDSLSGLVTTNEGSIVLIGLGNVTANDRVAADGVGDILLLTVTGTLASVDYTADIDLNAPVSSGSGNISILAGNHLIQRPDGDVTTQGGDITGFATDGSITMEDGALSATENGNIIYLASSNIFLGGLDAGTGDVNLVSFGGDILDGGDTHTDVVARALQIFALEGGVGLTNNALDVTVDLLGALALDGGIRITESDDLVIGNVQPIINNLVLPDGTLTQTNLPGMAGLVVSNGHILVDTLAGSIVVSNVIANADEGNILLRAAGPDSDIVVLDLIYAEHGNLSMIAARDVLQDADVLSVGSGSIDVYAEAGSITMIDSNVTFAANGAVRYHARDDITVSSLISASNTVSLIAETGNIYDGGDDLLDIIAPNLRIQAARGAGTESNAMDTLIGFLSARVGEDGLFLENQGILLIDTIADVTTDRVLLDGSTLAVIDEAQSDLIATNGGSIRLSTVDGSIIVLDGEAPEDGRAIAAFGGGTISLNANGSNSLVYIDADIFSESGDICIKADSHVVITTNNVLISAGGRGAIALWADNDGDGSGDILQLGGTVRSQSGNIYYAGENIRLLGRSRVQSTFGSISMRAADQFTMSGQSRITTLFGAIAMQGRDININGQVRGGTVGLTAQRDIKGRGKVIGNSISLRAGRHIGTARTAFNVDAGVLAAQTSRGNIWLIEDNNVTMGAVPRINLRFGIPECAALIPTASARPLSGMLSAGFIELDVGGNLNGNFVQAAGNIDLNVRGSVNGLDTLRAGGNIRATVGGDYTGREIFAGGDLNAVIGGDLRFDTMEAGRIFVQARNIYMSRVVARRFAEFRARQNIFDARSLVTTPDIIMIAGTTIGENAAIQLNAQRIDTIQGGGNVRIVQIKAGDTPFNLLQAGGTLNVSVPNGGLSDRRNNNQVNIVASQGIISAHYMGTLENPLDVRIGPGNLLVDGGTLSGRDTPDGYIFIHMNGEIGKVGGRTFDFIGAKQIPGLIIYNSRIMGGKDDILRRFKRAYGWLGEAERIAGPEGQWSDNLYFRTLLQPTGDSWETFIHYIIRDQAEISGEDGLLPATADKEKPGTSEPPKAKTTEEAKGTPLAVLR
ncbi:MAG TPA: filamentous hemagglutinin N-terminal domain-containing protein [Kiritimatiellia bacterium]|nr:filamentous hemagglutinin N-terminal domain-containing protein [Kiritimatiellia bacterium]